jgi:hypothetical protein
MFRDIIPSPETQSASNAPDSSNSSSSSDSDHDAGLCVQPKTTAASSVKLRKSLYKKEMLQKLEVALTRFDQVRFRLNRLGKRRSLHEIFERNRHFYYPQRLWIAFALAVVGIVFFFALYIFLTFRFIELLISFRIQIMNILAQINAFIGAAPTFLRLMTATFLQGLAGLSTLVSSTVSYLLILSGSSTALGDIGLPEGLTKELPAVVSAFMQSESSAATAASAQV